MLASSVSWSGWPKVASLLTALAAVAALWFTGQSLRATQDQIGLTEQGQLTDRFGKAVEQLGSDKVDVRLGGIYALERLSRDSSRDQPTIVDLLAAFVRTRARPAFDCDFPDRANVHPDSDVQAALTAIGRRDRTRPDAGKINLSHLCLSGVDLAEATLAYADLSFTTLEGANLSRVNLDNANLYHADLAETDLADASLNSVNLAQSSLCRTSLSRASLVKALVRGADLSNAKLDNADLSQATGYPITLGPLDDELLKYTTTFSGADLREARLTHADFRETDFSRAILTGANLSNANVSNSSFDRAAMGFSVYSAFAGVPTDLTNAQLNNANLTGVNLTRGVRLNGADLSGAVGVTR